MSQRTRKLVARWIGIAAAVAILAALMVFRRQLTEEYYIWRLASKDPTERASAVAQLLEIGTSRCLPALVKLIETETDPAEWARAAMVIREVVNKNAQWMDKFLSGFTENAVVQARLLTTTLVLEGCDGFVHEARIGIAVMSIKTIGSLGRDGVSSVASPLREAARCRYEEVRVAARGVLQRFELPVQ